MARRSSEQNPRNAKESGIRHAQVYRAHDTKLDRDVAIKILPDAFVADPERVARFQREAKTLASLNHPNVAHIHVLEDPAARCRSTN